MEGGWGEASATEFAMKLFAEGCFLIFDFPSLFSIKNAGFLSVFLSGAKDLTVPVNLSGNGLDGFGEAIALQLTLPNDNYGPAFGLKQAPGLLVAFLISGYLRGPKIGVGFGDGVVLTVFVAVPKAAVNENDCAVLW